MNLTPSQEAAIFHKDGPMLVLAGPGSGKTFVITRRIKTLIETHSVNPGSILVISFTRAAATEMKERFLKLMGKSQTQVVFGTFHSIFFTILKNSFQYSSDCIISDSEKHLLLRRIAGNHIPQGEDKEEFLQLFFKEFQKSEAQNENPFSREEFHQIYQEYVTQLKAEKRLDFEQILSQCHGLLKNYPSILEFWQNRFSYILIDEFQDINPIQFQTIELLAKPKNNLFVVGDDDQAIYGFRGSKPDIMLKFPETYPESKQILLDKNFRCGQTIVDHSIKLIEQNQTRFSKAISPSRAEIGQIFVEKFETSKPECDFILNSIKEGLSKGLSYKDMAVLFRIHSSTKNLIAALRRANIPFLLKDKISGSLDHWICQDLLCYLRLSKGQGTRQDFVRILDKPFHGIYRSDLKQEWNPKNLRENFWSPAADRTAAFQTFFQKMDFLSTLTPPLAVSYIQNAFGYEKFLRKHAAKQEIEAGDLLDIVEEFKELAKEAANFQDLEQLLEDRREILNQSLTDDFDGISLMSFHSSKGLEFKRVYLLDCNEDITPYKKAVTDAETEEERRMFYVAVTRAKDELFLCCLERLFNKKLAPSRFLGEFMGEEEFIK